MRTMLAAALGAALAAGTARADQTVTPDWMKVDAAHKTVSLDVQAGWNPNNGALNFNGYYEGDMTIVVPSGWTVKTAVMNHDGMLPHSLLITKPYPRDGIPPEAGESQVAINKAYTDNPVGGLAPNQKDSFSFRAPNEDGSYWLFCGVPGHGLQGMYVNLRVDTKVEAPEVIVKDGAASGRP